MAEAIRVQRGGSPGRLNAEGWHLDTVDLEIEASPSRRIARRADRRTPALQRTGGGGTDGGGAGALDDAGLEMSGSIAAFDSHLNTNLILDMLLCEFSARFSAIAGDEIDAEIETWLPRLVEAFDVDRSSFAELTPAGGIAVTHSYAIPGVDPYPRGLADLSLPWLVQEFKARRPVILSRIPEDLPHQAGLERHYFTTSGMQSGIGIPVSIGGSLICVLTFASFRAPRDWTADIIARLHIAGDVLANALARRQAKARLEQKQQELAHVGRVAAMGELASVIAHELDQPLTAVVSNAEAVRHMLESDDPDLAEADDALKDVIESAMRVSEIVKRERRLLRKTPVCFAQVDLNEAVREIELFIRAEAAQSGTGVTFELLPGLPGVHGDRVQLQQVILNLTHNACQAMRDQPRGRRRTTVRTCVENRQVVLTVTDAGPPIDDITLRQMFEPFYTTKANGLGMGLSISKSIIDAHHGHIWATRNSADNTAASNGNGNGHAGNSNGNGNGHAGNSNGNGNGHGVGHGHGHDVPGVTMHIAIPRGNANSDGNANSNGNANGSEK